MENPFVFGVPVEGTYFANREKEKKEVLDSLRAGQNLILFAPRRYGKSSLLREVTSSMGKQYAVVWIDVSEASTLRDFLEAIVRQFHKLSKGAKIGDFIKETLPRFLSMFKVRLGDLDISITPPSQADLENLALEVFDLPEKMATKLKKRIIVILDEFQDLLLLSRDIDKKMRARIQYHKSASYVFMGSRRSLIDKMFFDRKSPFYFIGKKVEINYIEREDFKPFIRQKFNTTGKEVDEHQIGRILDFTGGHPYFTQNLCFEIWNSTFGKVTPQIIEDSLSRCILSQSYIYDMLIDQIRNREQRAILYHLAKYGSKDIFGMDTLRELEIKNPNSLNYALKILMDREIIEKSRKGKYRFVDPFFALYLRRKLHS